MTGRIGDQWGVGDIDHGTGQSNITLVYPSNVIYATEWNIIIDAVNRTLAHQGSANIIPSLVHINDLVTAYASIDSGSTAAYNNAGTTGIAKVPTVYTSTYAGEWGSSGARTLIINQTLTFSTGDAARYFFNAGGTVEISFSHSGGVVAGPNPPANSNAQWDAFATACGTIVFGYKNTTKSGGSGSPTTIRNANNGGYWNSTSPAVVHFKQFDTALTSNYVQVEYWWSGTPSHSGSPVLNFRTTWANVTGSLPLVVNGNTNTILTVNAPSTTYLANTWGTPVFAQTLPAFPTAGTSLGTYCVGYNQWEATANGSGGITQAQVVTNSPSCGYVPPPAGVTLGLTQPVYNTNQLTWSAVAGATSYNLYRGTAGPASETLLGIGGQTSPYNDTGLTNGVTYYYYVKAVGGTPSAEGGASNEVSGTITPPAPPPSTPIGLTVTPASGQNTLNWTAVSGATSYKVYRSLSTGTETLLTSAGSNSYVDTGLTNGTTYFYKVSAVGPGGESALSTEASGTPAASGSPPASPPASITVTAGNAQNTITWPSAAGATSYNLYRSLTTNTETLYVTGASSGYVNTGLTNGTTYFYKVTAVNAYGESGLSSEGSGTPSAPPAVPSPPTIALSNSGTTNTITWGAVGGATSYNLYRGTAGSGSETLIGVGGQTSPYNDTGLIVGTTYYYKATAVNGSGESAFSNEVSYTPSITPAATLAGSGLLYSFNNNTGVFTYYAIDTYFLQPGKVVLGEWVTTSGDAARQTGVIVQGTTSTNPNYNFTVTILTTENTAITGTGPTPISVTVGQAPFVIYSSLYPSGGYARSWYSDDYMSALSFKSLTLSGSHVYLTLSLEYKYITGSVLTGSGTKDSPYVWVNTYAPCYFEVPLEFTKIW